MTLQMSHAVPMTRPRPRQDDRRVAVSFLAFALVPLIGLGVVVGAWITNPIRFNPRSVLHVTGTRPADGATSVLPNSFIAADVHLPRRGQGVDARTISAESVKLYRAKDHAPVKATANTSGAGDALVLQPAEVLAPQTAYTFEVTPDLKDTAGTPFHP